MIVVLNAEEIAELDKPVVCKKIGGFQGLLISLQKRLDRSNGALMLKLADIERIHRYAFDYKQGGFEDRLVAIFKRSLGADLLRTVAVAEQTAQLSFFS